MRNSNICIRFIGEKGAHIFWTATKLTLGFVQIFICARHKKLIMITDLLGRIAEENENEYEHVGLFFSASGN